MTASTTMPAVARYAVALGDDALVLAQRCGEWITRAPQLEEDVALGNIGLDLLGQARTLLTYAGDLEGDGRDEDDLAYQRDERDFLNVHLVELPNGDFAFSMARLLVFAAYQELLYARLAESRDELLAGVAGKAVKEVAYHRDHAASWVERLGDGTSLSRQRMADGLAAVLPYADELFDGAPVDADLLERGIAVDPAALRPSWERTLRTTLQAATLPWPDVRPAVTGGRRGIHTEHLGFLLAELQHLHRSHPGATW